MKAVHSIAVLAIDGFKMDAWSTAGGGETEGQRSAQLQHTRTHSNSPWLLISLAGCVVLEYGGLRGPARHAAAAEDFDCPEAGIGGANF